MAEADAVVPAAQARATAPTTDEIRERAYDIWERNCRPEGFEVAFWIMAERELRAERAASRAARDTGDADGGKLTRVMGGSAIKG